MKHLDLFSGIGGFALAVEMVWPDAEHTFCDNEPFAQAVLAKHWPNSKIYGDIRKLTADTESREQQQLAMERQSNKKINPSIKGNQFDLLTGGFPCQPFSQAGRRRGTEDDRYLWPEMLRVIREFHPRWVIGENVGGLVTWSNGMVLEQVHADLEAAGYEVQAFIIPAAGVNAPHRRDRVWIVAHRVGSQLRQQSGRGSGKSGQGKVFDGIPNENAPDSQKCGRRQGDTDTRRGGEGTQPTKEWKRFTDRTGWSEPWLEIATRLCRVDDGIPRRLDRTPRLKALGNAIVPQVAAEIMRAIRAADTYDD